MSVAWNRFENEFLNANSWAMRKDGFPAELLDALSPNERSKAVDILKEQLNGRDDWPIRAMAHLHVSDSVSRLYELLAICTSPVMRAVIATSIYELTGDTDMESIVAAVAVDKGLHWCHRIDAIHCLAKFKTETATESLIALTKDSDYLVSYNAKRAGGRLN